MEFNPWAKESISEPSRWLSPAGVTAVMTSIIAIVAVVAASQGIAPLPRWAGYIALPLAVACFIYWLMLYGRQMRIHRRVQSRLKAINDSAGSATKAIVAWASWTEPDAIVVKTGEATACFRLAVCNRAPFAARVTRVSLIWRVEGVHGLKFSDDGPVGWEQMDPGWPPFIYEKELVSAAPGEKLSGIVKVRVTGRLVVEGGSWNGASEYEVNSAAWVHVQDHR